MNKVDKENELTNEEFFKWINWVGSQHFSARKKFILNTIGTFGKDLCLFEKSIELIKQEKYKEVSNRFIADRNDKLLE